MPQTAACCLPVSAAARRAAGDRDRGRRLWRARGAAGWLGVAGRGGSEGGGGAWRLTAVPFAARQCWPLPPAPGA